MRTHLAMGRNYFTISVVCGIFASFSISPHGGLCGLACSPAPVAPVQELVHQSTVVFEGKLQDEGRKHDINQEERETLRNQRAKRVRRNDSEVQVPNRTSDSEPYQVRIKVHQVWEIKAGGLEKDSIVDIVWNRGVNCFLTLSKDTRYMFFMEPTNDTLVFNAMFPPVETRRAIRKDVSKVLCKDCAEPRLKEMKSVTVPEGRKTVLKCEVGAGNPEPRIRWYKEGRELTGDNKLKDAKFKKRKKGKVSELHIKKAADVHAGSYTCEASNNLGKASAVGNLTLIHDHTVPHSTTPAVKTSSHVTRCSDSKKNYCVNGGECFTLEVTPGSSKYLCRCPNEFTGDRCQNYVMASFYKHLGIEFMEAEELYQKRVLTITGICIALLVVGIMCVVAYCKTKKQRKKLHDRLRRSLRNERNNMAGMANGPHIPNPPLENVQLVNQYVCKNAMPAQHVMEKDTETSFSTSQYTSSAHQSTTVTHTSSQSWSNGQSQSLLSDSRSILVMSSAETSRHATPSRRGRLNATGGARDVSGHLKNSRDTPDSYRDSPYSERYVSAMTTPTRMSPVDLASPATPGSPPSEASAPLSSLAASVPSVAVSPSGEEERPLLFATPPRPRDKPTSQSKRNSAHYNHGHEAHSPPPSPLRIVEDGDYETTREYEAGGAGKAVPVPPQSFPKNLANANNNNVRRAKRTKANSHAGHNMEAGSSSSSSSARSGCDSEADEDERVGEDTPFLSIQIPMETASALRPADSSRTNPALRLSPQDDLQARLASAIANQDPIAV